MRSLSSLSLCAWLAVTACGGGGKTDTPPSPGGSASTPSPLKPAQAPYVVEVLVNDKPAAHVTSAQLMEWPRLDALLPAEDRKLGQWTAITTVTGDGKTNELQKPFDTYPDMVPAVFPATGGAGFGMFDTVELAKQGKAGMHEDNIKTIKVTINTGGTHGGNDDNDEIGDPTKLTLTFKTPAGETPFPGDKLIQLPRIAMPGNNGEVKGWKLSALLEAGGVKTFDKLLLTDAQGTNVTLEKADFDESKSIPFARLNKKGKLRFTVYKKQGDGWTPSADLRALVSVEVLK